MDAYHTLEQHIDLLSERGYLDANFKTPTQMGYWLKEFQEQFDQAYLQAHLSQKAVRFITEINGRFNSQLDTVHFNFRYLYDPEPNELRLTSLYARLYEFKKPYYFHRELDLPAAQEVYDTLAKAVALKGDQPRNKHLRYEFNRDKNIDNDYQAPNPGDKQRINPWDIKDVPPLKLKIRRR